MKHNYNDTGFSFTLDLAINHYLNSCTSTGIHSPFWTLDTFNKNSKVKKKLLTSSVFKQRNCAKYGLQTILDEFNSHVTEIKYTLFQVSEVLVVNLIWIIPHFFLIQELFEKLFSPYGSDEKSFLYLRTFHRARVTFNMEENAKEAKKDLHGQQFLGHELGVFLVQVIIHIVFFRI